MISKVIGIIAIFSCMHLVTYGQNDKVHLQCIKGAHKDYKILASSASHCFGEEAYYDIPFSLEEDMLYHISVCTNETMDWFTPFTIYVEKGVMQFDEQKNRIVEKMVPVKVYSSKDDNMSHTVEFQASGDKNGFVRIFPLIEVEQACLGVLIQSREAE